MVIVDFSFSDGIEITLLPVSRLTPRKVSFVHGETHLSQLILKPKSVNTDISMSMACLHSLSDSAVRKKSSI